MKKCYLAISYSNRSQFDNEIESLKKLFKENNMELLVFVDKYNFKTNQEKEMMKTAFDEIDNSDFYEGSFSARSGDIDDDQSTTMMIEACVLND